MTGDRMMDQQKSSRSASNFPNFQQKTGKMEQQTQQTAGLLVAVVLQLPYLILHSEKLMADELRDTVTVSACPLHCTWRGPRSEATLARYTYPSLVTMGIPMTHCKPWDYSGINHRPTGAGFRNISIIPKNRFSTHVTRSILLQDFEAMQSFLCDFTRHIGYLPPGHCRSRA